jgi:hypothetical protein
MSYIIYAQQDGKLAIVYPASDVSIEDVVKRSVPANTPHSIVSDVSHIESDYADGYIYEDGEAVADIDKCKSLHLDKFRAARAPKLAALDVAFMRAVEQGDAEKQSEIAAIKQELRDVTKVELPETLEEIKAVWPEILS